MRNLLIVLYCVEGSVAGILLFLFMQSHPEFVGAYKLWIFIWATFLVIGIGALIETIIYRLYKRKEKK